jgi:hypothetical protein
MCPNLAYPQFSFYNYLAGIMILNINMFCPIMKHLILCKENSTLTITIDVQMGRPTRYDLGPCQAWHEQAHGPAGPGLHSPACLGSRPGMALWAIFRPYQPEKPWPKRGSGQCEARQ